MNNPKNLKVDANYFKSVGSTDGSTISYIKNLNLSEEIQDDTDDLLYNLSKDELKKLLNERATSLGLEPETHFKSAPELIISTPNRRQAEISDDYYSLNFNPRYDRLTAGPRVKHNKKLDEFTAKMQGKNINKNKPDYQRQRQRIESEIDFLKRIKSTRKKSGGRSKFKRKYKTKKNKRKYRNKLY
tara:strand:+ start:302 stop:859 length:558 start_codon:yes stop_codon:yes gene_type:complete